MEVKRNIFSAETLVPVSLVITLIGGVFWLSTMFANVQQNRNAITSLEEKIEEVNSNYVDLLDRTARIETKLDLILEALE